MEVNSTGNPFLGFLSSLVITIFISIASVITLYWLSLRIRFSRDLKKGGEEDHLAFLSIKIPSSNKSKADAMEDFLRSLHHLLPKNTYLSLEMSSINQFLSFYMVIPREFQAALEAQLYAQFPDAEVSPSNDPLAELKDTSAISELQLKKSSIHPIDTYKDLSEDFLKILSAALSKTEPGEQVYLQFILKRAGSKFFERGLHATKAKLFSHSSDKLSSDLYLGKVRLVYTSSSQALAKTKLKTLVNLFKAIKGPNNSLKSKNKSISEPVIKILQARVFSGNNLWTPAEISTIYHFPYEGSVVSNVIHSTSKYAPAPDNLPYHGLVDSKEVSFFGETNYRNEKRIFGIKRVDRRRHLYVVGKTGSGKSRLLQLLLISDILSGQGCCLLDPHGDLAQELLEYIPKERINDVVYIDPSDREFPIGFNPLEPVESYETRQHLATFFISIFRKLFAANWNPRMEHLIRYITLALLETPDSNVLGIPRMLSDTKFRQRVIMQIKDPVVKGFWTNEFSASAEQFSREAVVPILNKVGQFISNPIVRNMVGQRKNMLDFAKFMNEGKIVIINISKGKLGDDNAALLGSMFITKIQQAALSRANMPEDERRDFYFYVDEFQNFATDAFSSILSEARKYHLDLTIAHQYIAQLPEEVKATAFGNVGSLIVFPVGGDDAAYLAKEFSPTFSADDMINLNLREMYIKLSVEGKITPPFSARTINVPKSSTDFSREILSHSRLTYGRNKTSVENEIRKWTESTEDIAQENGDLPEPLI